MTVESKLGDSLSLAKILIKDKDKEINYLKDKIDELADIHYQSEQSVVVNVIETLIHGYCLDYKLVKLEENNE